MIDPAIIKRDAQANIADWPVTIRFPVGGTQITAAFSATDDVSVLMPGGLLDNPTATLLAIRSDFAVLPEPRDLIELRLANNTWKTFEIKSVPEYYDPLLPHFQFTIGTPDA